MGRSGVSGRFADPIPEDGLTRSAASNRARATAIGPPGRRGQILLLLAATGLGVAAGLLGPVFGAVVGVVFAAFLLVMFPAAGVGFLVAARSSLDHFQRVSILPGPLPLNPASALGLGLILLAFVVVVLKARVRSPIDWGGRVGGLWTIWLVASAFALVVAYLRFGGGVAAVGMKELVRLTSFYALYLLCANLVTPSRGAPRWLVWACFAGLVVPSLVGIYQVISGSATHNIHGIRRISGTFGHPNPFGVYLAGLSFLGFGFLQDLRRRHGQRLLLLVLVGTAFTLLLFTYSRSALGIVLGALLVWAVWGSVRRRLFVLGGLGVSVVLLLPVLAWRFQDLFVDLEQGPVSGEDASNSFAWRLINYRRLLGAFQESPIVGHGLTSISEINPTRTRTVEGFDSGFAAHNEIVRVLVEQGVIGLLVWVVVAIGIWRAVAVLSERQIASELGGHPRTGEALRALFLTLIVLSGVGMAFLNQTVLLYVIFTLLGALRVGARDPAPGRRRPVETP